MGYALTYSIEKLLVRFFILLGLLSFSFAHNFYQQNPKVLPKHYVESFSKTL